MKRLYFVYVCSMKLKINDIRKEAILKDILDSLYGLDIRDKTRKDEIVEARAIYIRILLENTNFNLNQIGRMIKRSRSNVYHIEQAICPSLTDKTLFKDVCLEFAKQMDKLGIKTAYGKSLGLNLSYEELLEERNQLLSIVEKGTPTESLDKNSIEYKIKSLNEQDYKTFCTRAEVIIKSFSWQKPKDEYEIINCGAL